MAWLSLEVMRGVLYMKEFVDTYLKSKFLQENGEHHITGFKIINKMKVYIVEPYY